MAIYGEVAGSLITAIEGVVCMQRADGVPQNFRTNGTSELDINVCGKDIICPSVLLRMRNVACRPTQRCIRPPTVIPRKAYNVIMLQRFMLSVVGENDKPQIATRGEKVFASACNHRGDELLVAARGAGQQGNCWPLWRERDRYTRNVS